MDTRDAKRKAEARRRIIASKKIERVEKREFGIFAAFVIVLFIAIILVSIYILCFTREIIVENNEYSTQGEIVQWIEEDPFVVNSIATFLKYNYTDCQLPGQVESIEIQLNSPWSITAVVKDKVPIGGFLMSDKYVYCDGEGTVVLVSAVQIDGIGIIEGIDVTEYTLYETIEVEDVDIFENALEVSTILGETGIEVDTISNNSGASVSIVIEDIEILLGVGDYQEKIAQIEPILVELEGQEGVLDLANFSTTNTTISFERKNSENSEN